MCEGHFWVLLGNVGPKQRSSIDLMLAIQIPIQPKMIDFLLYIQKIIWIDCKKVRI